MNTTPLIAIFSRHTPLADPLEPLLERRGMQFLLKQTHVVLGQTHSFHAAKDLLMALLQAPEARGLSVFLLSCPNVPTSTIIERSFQELNLLVDNLGDAGLFADASMSHLLNNTDEQTPIPQNSAIKSLGIEQLFQIGSYFRAPLIESIREAHFDIPEHPDEMTSAAPTLPAAEVVPTKLDLVELPFEKRAQRVELPDLTPKRTENTSLSLPLFYTVSGMVALALAAGAYTYLRWQQVRDDEQRVAQEQELAQTILESAALKAIRGP